MKAMAWGCLFCCLAGSAQAGQGIQDFTRGSYQQIIEQHQGQPFVLVLWSLDCPPCYQELAMLAAAQRQQAFNLVLIAVDGADARGEVEAVLAKYLFKSVGAWLFEEPGAPRLRHEIDPLWYGELPRSYLFDASHRRQAVSGLLSRAQLLRGQTR